jgi:hypothetical protein
MRRKKLLLVGVLLLALTVLVPAGAVADGGGNNAGPAGTKQPLVFQMVPGDHAAGETTSYGLWQAGGAEIHLVINMGPGMGAWRTEVVDGYIEGDTMLAIALGPGGPMWGWATSPNNIVFGPFSMPQYGWKLIIIGYIGCPGGFPAGWFWDHWM